MDRCLGGLVEGRLDRSHHSLATLSLLSALALINRAIENRWREVLISPNSALIRGCLEYCITHSPGVTKMVISYNSR